MWTRKLLKENGKIAFQRNYLTCVLACAVSGFLGSFVTTFLNKPDTTVTVEDLVIFYNVEKMEVFLSQIDMNVLMIGLMAAIVGFVISLCFSIFVTNVLAVGNNRYFLENREHKTSVGQVFYSFQDG